MRSECACYLVGAEMSGLFSFIGALFSENARHNLNLYSSHRADKTDVRYVTVGWRLDPINEEDGQTEAINTPSGEREYYRKVER